jgi:hypothetical protein
MLLSRRVSRIAIAVTALIALPAIARAQAPDPRHDAIPREEAQKPDDVVTRVIGLRKVWTQMVDKGGLGTDVAGARARLENSLADWSEESAVTVVQVGLLAAKPVPPRTAPEAKFKYRE